MDSYEEACRDLLGKIQAWQRENPDALPILQFQYPRTVFLIADLRQALHTGLIKPNESGQALLEACMDVPDVRMPTVGMFRAAWDMAARRVGSQNAKEAGTT